MSVPAIELRDVSFAYPGGREVLRALDLRVDEGERVGLVGPNGAGKSTLLLCLIGILDAKGAILVCGEELSRRTLRSIRAKVGLVFQDPDDQLFMPTIAEDVAFGPSQAGLSRDEVASRVNEALAAVGLEGEGERSPHHLSGGEKRAASLATVLSMRPAPFDLLRTPALSPSKVPARPGSAWILALDEPTTGLDPSSRRRVIELLTGLEGTLLVATHDLEAVLDICERAVLLAGDDEGGIVADGPVRDVLADAKLMEAHGLEVPLSIRLGGR